MELHKSLLGEINHVHVLINVILLDLLRANTAFAGPLSCQVTDSSDLIIIQSLLKHLHTGILNLRTQTTKTVKV